MIEAQTLAGPIALLRAMTQPASSDRVQDKSSRNLNPPDPNAPAGPRPTFKATPLERLREVHLAELRPVEATRRVVEAEAILAYRRGIETAAGDGTGLNRVF